MSATKKRPAKTKKAKKTKGKAKGKAKKVTAQLGVVQAKANAPAKGGKKPRAIPPAVLDGLVARATEARTRAYAPYSRYLVGAAIATKDGRVYAGCNVENSTFGASICAERNAVVQMVAAGDRQIAAVAVVTGDEGASPCGICRQVLAEFADDDVPVVMVGLEAEGGEAGRVVRLGDLLPFAFRLATDER
jgi:cytidine deaminase